MSSFEQTMMGWRPRGFIPSFVEIGLPVPEKNIFKGFLPYVGMAAILVMGPASCHQIFISFYLKAFIKKFGKEVSEKIWFEFLYVHDLGPRSKMTLTINTHISSIRCQLLLTCRSLAAIVSEKSTVFNFSYRKALVTKFDLAIKYVKVTPGLSFEQTMMGWSPRCYIPSTSFVEIRLWRRFFKGFYNMWVWRPSWSSDQHHVIRFSFPFT